MKREKLAVITLVVVITTALSGLILVENYDSIVNNLFRGYGIKAVPDDFYFNINSTGNKIDVLTNDDVKDYDVSVKVVEQPSHGVLTKQGSYFIYTPDPGFSGVDQFTYKLEYKGEETSAVNVNVSVVTPVEIGDCVEVNYVGRYQVNNTVFDTSYEDVARAEGLYDPSRSYQPLKVFVDPNNNMSTPSGYEDYSPTILGFTKGLIGMSIGENKTIVVPPEEGYGTWNVSLAEQFQGSNYSLDTVVNMTYTLSAQSFSYFFPDVNLSEGTVFDFGAVVFQQPGVLNASIQNVSNGNITWKLHPENGTVMEAPMSSGLNLTFIVTNDTAFTMHYNLKVNQTFTLRDYFLGQVHCKVVSINETHAKLAVNVDAPKISLVDQTLIYELNVTKIIKTSQQS